jgi:hypothetical protein
MAEDWRVTVKLRDEGRAARMLAVLHAHQAEGDARTRFGDRVAVSGSGSGDRIFLYADTESAAREATAFVLTTLADEGSESDVRLEHWHPREEAWEDASVPLPSTPEALQAEDARLERQEAAESRATGVAAWELRIEFASREDATAFARKLENDGYRHIVHRSSFLIVGAANRDEADVAVDALRDALPQGATIHVEPGSGLAWEVMPSNPFAVMGGLGG